MPHPVTKKELAKYLTDQFTFNRGCSEWREAIIQARQYFGILEPEPIKLHNGQKLYYFERPVYVISRQHYHKCHPVGDLSTGRRIPFFDPRDGRVNGALARHFTHVNGTPIEPDQTVELTDKPKDD